MGDPGAGHGSQKWRGQEGPRGAGGGREGGSTAPVPVNAACFVLGGGCTRVTPHGMCDAPWCGDHAWQCAQVIGERVQGVRAGGGGGAPSLVLSCGCCGGGGVFTAETLHVGDVVLRGGGRNACAQCARTCVLQGAGGGLAAGAWVLRGCARGCAPAPCARRGWRH